MILNQGRKVRIIELQKVCALAWVDIDYNPNPDLTLIGKSTSPDKAHEIYVRQDNHGQIWGVFMRCLIFCILLSVCFYVSQ